MLKMTKIKLEPITDPDMYIVFGKGTRGGISDISNRYSKANNKNILFTYTQIIGIVMSKFLPKGGFKWVDHKEFELNKYTNNSSKGCVLEVDFKYPKELRELHNNYPLASDKIEIKREMLSEYQLKNYDLYNIAIGKVKELVPNLFD